MFASLAPGASDTITYTYDVTQSDIDNHTSISNTATATNGTLSSSSSTTEPITQSPALTVSKSASILDTDSDGDTTAITDPSDDVKYTVVVKNSGNTTLTNTVFTDTQVPGADTTIASLAPGASDTITYTYDVTQRSEERRVGKESRSRWTPYP